MSWNSFSQFLRVLRIGAAIFAIALPSIAVTAESTVDGYYVGDVLYNADGGLKTGSSYLDDAGLIVQSEFESIFDSSDATFFAYILYNNGTTFSADYVGDIQGVSNIDTDGALSVYEFWYEQGLSASTSLRIGLYDLNSEFDAIDTAGAFINSSHGIGAEYAQSGENGPSIFPVTSLAARFDWQIAHTSTLRYALLDGVPGDPQHPGHTTVKLGGDDGVLHALEYNYRSNRGARFGIGTWRYSAKFDVIGNDNPGGQARRDGGNNGIYGFVDSPIIENRQSGITINGFVRYGVANDDFNALDSYIGAGVVAKGLLNSRPNDLVGIAIARANLGGPIKRALAADGIRSDSFEGSIELTYSAQITDLLRVQPNIQYIVNPGADPTLGDALVIGLRFELTTSSDVISHDWP